MTKKGITAALTAAVIGLTILYAYSRFKCESHRSKLESSTYILKEYDLLVKEIVRFRQSSDSLALSLAEQYTMRKLGDNYFVIEVENASVADFFGFYFLTNERGEIVEFGRHKP